MSVYTYRRGSIFWALSLIAVGSIFLYQNFNPSVHPWHIIAKFWPILIIFWGLSKLIDFLQAQAHPETVPPPLFSASEVVLLLLILMTGTFLSRVILHPDWHTAFGIDDEDWGRVFENTYTYSASISQPLKPQPHLVLEDQRGDVEIRGADQSTIDVAVKKVIRAENEDAAKRIADELKVEVVEQTGGHYELRSNRRSLSDSGRVSMDLTITVPASTSIEMTSERGDVNLSGLRGDQTITANHGDVHLSGVTGLVRVHKTGGTTEIHDIKGNVQVDGQGNDLDVASVAGTVTVNGDFSGTLQFRDVAGTLHYVSSRTDLTTQHLAGRLDMETGSLEASDVEGPFEISTKQKDLTLENFRDLVKITNTNGDVHLSTSVAPTHPIEVNLGKGEIELDIPPASNFQIDATSHHGDVESDFESLKINKEGDTPSISGSNGKGGTTIRLTTSYGTIHVGHEQAAGPAAPAVPSQPRPPRVPAGHEKVFFRRPHVPRPFYARKARLSRVVVLKAPWFPQTPFVGR